MRLYRFTRLFTALAPAVVLAACGPSDNDPGPGGVSVGEARALDEAAEMIEARRLPPDAIQTQNTDGDGQQAPPNGEENSQ